MPERFASAAPVNREFSSFTQTPSFHKKKTHREPVAQAPCGFFFSCASRSRTYDGGVKVPCLTAWRWRTGKNQYSRISFICQAKAFCRVCADKSITKFNKFSPDFLCILAQHKQAVKFCFLAASFIRSVLPILSSRPAFPAMRSLSYIMVTLLFVMRSAPVPAGIGGTWSPHSYTRESSGGSC